MRRKFLVLALNRREAEDWRRRHNLMVCDVFYLLHHTRLFGLRPADYAGVILPGFYERRDALETEDRLRRMVELDPRTDWPLWREAAHERASL